MKQVPQQKDAMTKATTRIDPLLKPYATAKEWKVLEAVIKHGSSEDAAKKLGVHRATVDRQIAKVKKTASLAGYAPGHFDNGVAAGYRMGKVTVQRGADGEVERTWERQSPELINSLEAMREFASSLAAGIEGMSPKVKGPRFEATDLLCVYPWGDPHFGMYAWWKEVGTNFDLDIAEKLTKDAVDRLVATAPVGSTGLLLNLGDMFHADNQKNTTQSGHQLDVDGRWAEVQQVGLRSMIHCILRMLEVHSKVIVKINKGNHDGQSSYALSLMLSCYFHNEPRVTVDLSPAVHWYFKFGKVLLGSTHGDETKGKDMGAVMAADKPKLWGDSTFRYWYVGHVHHKDIKEYPGVIVEYMRTLAARDAWHQGQGYRAGRDMQLIVHHIEHGEIERHRCDIGMIENGNAVQEHAAVQS